jgi:hypothetical protein
MSVKELAIKAAELCIAADADRWADIAAHVWDTETDDKSVSDRRPEDIANPGRRSNVIFGFMAFGCYQEKAWYVKRLITLAEFAHYREAHGIDSDKVIEQLKADLKSHAGKFPDVDAYITIEQAETGSFWDFY